MLQSVGVSFPLVSCRSYGWSLLGSRVGNRGHSASRKSSTPAANRIVDTPLLRTNIGIFGAMNVGKSTLMNVITGTQTSIVDSKPGTTADTKVALMEVHGLGPVKLFDTPGIDEEGLLGDKKRVKAMGNLNESDIVVVVVNPYELSSVLPAQTIISKMLAQRKPGDRKANKLLVLFNLFSSGHQTSQQDFNTLLEATEDKLGIRNKAGELLCPTLAVNLADPNAGSRVIAWVESASKQHTSAVPLIPTHVGLPHDSVVFLNIPMDEETPNARFLRPQAITQEALVRNYVNTFAYRMDLRKARSTDVRIRETEEKRFRDNINVLKTGDRLKLLITDSQAVDVVDPWTMDKKTGAELVPITTFSICMINYLSQGRLPQFVEGLRRFEKLGKGDRVLICEACNHDRILDDIGTKQIPAGIARRFGQGVVKVEHAFGREYQQRDLRQYSLVVHCGGCMLDQQGMGSRLNDLEQSKVPITNYGLVLSLLRSRAALSRVVKPFGLSL
ncbi:hydrogen maturase HydF, mitochondrial [Pelomyxa schiedti]|nr:hydrogen maturase HydF, mitochondrial [Pelomyxa schiedti]